MKVYLVQTRLLPFDGAYVKSIHQTLEGAAKEMMNQSLILMRDKGLIVLDKTDYRIVFGGLGYSYTDIEETVELFINEMEVQE